MVRKFSKTLLGYFGKKNSFKNFTYTFVTYTFGNSFNLIKKKIHIILGKGHVALTLIIDYKNKCRAVRFNYLF